MSSNLSGQSINCTKVSHYEVYSWEKSSECFVQIVEHHKPINKICTTDKILEIDGVIYTKVSTEWNHKTDFVSSAMSLYRDEDEELVICLATFSVVFGEIFLGKSKVEIFYPYSHKIIFYLAE